MSKKENINQDEINKFSTYENDWWDKNSYTAPLHRINPLRKEFITSHANLKNKYCLDVGCGGGILTEELAKEGGLTTGIDATESAIYAAKNHAEENNLSITYQHTTIEKFLTKNKKQFEVITCLELLEHVPNPKEMVESISKLAKKDGFIFFSTINRNPKSFLFAILGAEYILRMIPAGTHNYKDFIKPSELDSWCQKSDLKFVDILGINYNPLSDKFYTSKDISVNYIAVYKKL
jgi:2-polyprenyl-6-hydroxyphenyl methylase/3-demethylubiquinone-9 3-methyltransferase